MICGAQVDEAKRAYHEVEALEDEDGDCGMAANGDDAECSKANYREVGHNIYILAHQVFRLHNTLRLSTLQ